MHMITTILRQCAHKATTLAIIPGVIIGMSLASSVAAAPPQKVSYYGTAVTSAVPGKPFTLKFRVQNIGDDIYSGVKVIFHIPDGLTYSSVGPDDASIDGQTITWENVPLEPDQSFYPSFTFAVDSGTAIKTKLNIWVEVLGTGMENTSTNFSVTAAAATKTTKTTLTSADVNSLFNSVYGRTPTAKELKYWLGRRTDKPGRTALLGAIAYAKANSIKH